MKTDLGVEIPRRVHAVGVAAVVLIVTGGLLGGVTTSGRVPVAVGAPATVALLLLGVVLLVVTMRLGAELRRTSAVEFERRGHARGEIVASWRLHWWQLGIAAGVIIVAALLLVFGEGHWGNVLVIVGSSVTFVVYARSAYLRRRREQRQRARGSTAGEAE
ncbi:MFS family permease [Nocardioides zeae]|uniref:MFS family permease n=1 Tax=Nocardioides zeae TaxID=1457234 RepID=A0ACC6ICR1_9ACTN|nr:hypothetical protein [Nocardioides zeae]MDR6175543.1 MFS family permease [Nocardioides zeae]MDR6208474.1 MFS family permease [Nocardioides zeae]